MSRLSRANLRARDSIFTSGPEVYRGDFHATCPVDLEECVMTLEDCNEETREAQLLLRSGTEDLPRMNKILQNQRVFLLIDEKTVDRYKMDLADEIEPAINEMLERAEQGLKLLQRKEALLQAKVENMRSAPPKVAAPSHRPETRRMQMLTKQSQKLENEVVALEAEIRQLVRNRQSLSFWEEDSSDPHRNDRRRMQSGIVLIVK
ncbi:hypothetical protein FISHEDRAFT_64179 [Fistulina hepatica ATCC 64428]|uniref:DASH complex subunit SPC19 n=1 Tax=Fistulina hepatica ATCC 64428 TaxID=1128425 RepID=A0A0D7ALL3_9AGAR|nr:hypothetical protein FISHEDRAFT_64179 [Fistulina hepatica ATCC 64428]